MSENRLILPPSSMAELVQIIADIDDVAFEALSRAIASERSFTPEEAEVDELLPLVKLPKEILSYLFAGLSFLNDRVQDDAGGSNQLEDSVETLIEQLKLFRDDISKKDELKRRLLKLFSPNKSHELYQKVKRLQKGFIPNLVEVKTFVDVRPSISKDRSQIDGFINLFQLCIVTDADIRSERKIVIQLTRKSLNTLRDALDDLVTKDELVASKLKFDTKSIASSK
jgi:hypothetical protein